MNEKILITGGCGFVGSNLAIKLKTEHPLSTIIAFDNLKRRGSELNIPRLKENGVIFIHGDIRNKEDFNSISDISILIEAAAEPSVLSGIDSTPDYVLNTNLVGTINCLNFALKHQAKFIFLSTSRVYPISNLNQLHFDINETRFTLSENQTLLGVSKDGISENFPLNGARSFYGTSKLSSEMLIQEYTEFYGLKSIINRCGVITGPWQMGKIDQGVVVLWLVKHYWKKELSYIGFGGKGKQLRDILHIEDLYRLINMQICDFNKFNKGIFNVGGGIDVSVSLSELTSLCQDITGNKIVINSIIENRLADIPIYVTDNSKINKLCGWEPTFKPREIIKDVFNWIKTNEEIIKPLLN
ncbi:MAG: NAD-dependent epimerase/dehydratase family protein [Flavobacteriales bacterium]|nr:NAD-dependent epimerase/dehydratase family protein [Flavobacteriales bacterium]